jgi:hypothetical protein
MTPCSVVLPKFAGSLYRRAKQGGELGLAFLPLYPWLQKKLRPLHLGVKFPIGKYLNKNFLTTDEH